MFKISLGRSGNGLIMTITQSIGPDPFCLPTVTSVRMNPAQIDDLRKKLAQFEQPAKPTDG